LYSQYSAGQYIKNRSDSKRFPQFGWLKTLILYPRTGGVRSGEGTFAQGGDSMPAAVEAYTKTEVNLGGVVVLAAGTMSVTTNMRNVKPI
jgi:hypothetical protein